eukprot:1033677-Lingulodinium_polyedra.AAC.1
MDKLDMRMPVALLAPAHAPESSQANMTAGHHAHLGYYARQRSRLWDYAQSDVPSGECTHRLE